MEESKKPLVCLRASFGPRGHWIRTVSQAKQARLWDARMGLPVSEPFSRRAAVTDARFARDASRWPVHR